ncbi:MAG: hypothetical protein WAW73_07310 [Rhodoferax sp.]
MKTTITFEIDTDALNGFTDAYLSQLWHIAQANPAPISDVEAGRLAEAVGREIIRRWLGTTPPELYTHQGHQHYWNALAIGLQAKCKDGEWSIQTDGGAS